MSGSPAATSTTRRRFLHSAALGTCGLVWAGWPALASAAGRKIERVETFAARYPTVGRFKFLEGPPGTPSGRQSVFVRITCDDGAVGWGQSVPVPKWSYETLESVQSTIDTYLAPVLIGRDPADLAGAHGAMNAAIAPSYSTGAPITKAGVDLALHDLVARATGESVAERWGRAVTPSILLSWTLNPKTLDEVEPLVEQGRQRGYRHFNVKVAPDPGFDVELCRLVKRRVPEGFLWADANGGYDLATALAAAPKLAEVGVAVLEQPLPSNRLSGFRELKAQGALPIILDEGVVSPGDLLEFIRLGLLDGVAMKPARCGGLLPARREVEILLDAGLMFLGSGLTDPDLSLAASLLLYGAYGLQHPAALNGPQFLEGSVLREPLVAADGRLAVPTGPGLGVEVDEHKLAELVAASAGPA